MRSCQYIDGSLDWELAEEEITVNPDPVTLIEGLKKAISPFILTEIGYRWLLPAIWSYINSYVSPLVVMGTELIPR